MISKVFVIRNIIIDMGPIFSC